MNNIVHFMVLFITIYCLFGVACNFECTGQFINNTKGNKFFCMLLSYE